MRKWLIVTMLLLLVVGCTNKTESTDKIKLENYAYIYQTITDNDTFNTVSSFYDMQVVMTKISDAEYRYDIIIDDPKIAMYNIKMMAVENNIEYSMADKMMPSIGIFDDSEYNMVPYQVNVDLGYVAGLIISGTTDSSIVNLKIRITWKDYSKVVETKEYYNVTVDYDSQKAAETQDTSGDQTATDSVSDENVVDE
ncbi:MAG: hypothetical protein VB012_01250 [Erysipelotrichaceae bacterium]|nr:hypothetical protein [Erysipelotrichaceae bacterium]